MLTECLRGAVNIGHGQVSDPFGATVGVARHHHARDWHALIEDGGVATVVQERPAEERAVEGLRGCDVLRDEVAPDELSGADRLRCLARDGRQPRQIGLCRAGRPEQQGRSRVRVRVCAEAVRSGRRMIHAIPSRFGRLDDRRRAI